MKYSTTLQRKKVGCNCVNELEIMVYSIDKVELFIVDLETSDIKQFVNISSPPSRRCKLTFT